MKKKMDVTVIMSVYNCEKELPEAIDSILGQTCGNLELIICDDCSTDQTWQVAHSYAVAHPGKILLLKNGRNRGQAYSRNRCILKARGRYIAMMDGDDRCSPLRIEKEMAFLEFHPEYAYVGTWMRMFDHRGFWGEFRYKEKPEPDDYVRRLPFCAASCLFRKEVLLEAGKYNESPRYSRVEDYRMMLSLMAAGFRGYNLQEFLYEYREGEEAYARRKFRYRLHSSRVRFEAIRELGLPVTKAVVALRPVAVGLVPADLYRVIHRILRRAK